MGLLFGFLKRKKGDFWRGALPVFAIERTNIQKLGSIHIYKSVRPKTEIERVNQHETETNENNTVIYGRLFA
jgi:hypothetical protein